MRAWKYLNGVPAAVVIFAGGAALPAWTQEAEPFETAEIERGDGFPLPASPWQSAGRQSLRMPNVGYGSLRLSSQSLFQALRLNLPAEAPSSLAGGHWEVRESSTWSRIWAQSDDYLLSFDTLSKTHSVVYGVTDRLQVQLGAVESIRFGGSLDGFVRDFHDLFGIDQGGRDTVRGGAFSFDLKGNNGRVVLEEEPGEAASEYVFVSLQGTLTPGSETVPAVATSLSLKTGLTDASDVSGDSVEIAGTVSLAKRWGDFHGYLVVGLAWFGHESFYGLDLRPFGASLQAALEWNLFDAASVVLQLLWSQGALQGAGPFSEPSYECALGLKIEVGRGTVLEVGLTENVVVFDNSPDFGVHAGLTTRF